MRRLLFGGPRLLIQRAAELARVDLRRALAAEPMPGEDTKHDWGEHREQPPRLVLIESARLLNALMHGVTVGAEDASQESANAATVRGRSSLKYASEIVGHSPVRTDCLLNRACAVRLRRMPRHATEDHG